MLFRNGSSAIPAMNERSAVTRIFIHSGVGGIEVGAKMNIAIMVYWNSSAHVIVNWRFQSVNKTIANLLDTQAPISGPEDERDV